MRISPAIHQVFGHFQNLNLLALLNDLGNGESVRQAWSASGRLCPVAHGLPAGQQVRELTILGQAADLGKGCDYAAQHLGANPDAVLRFVRSWDEGAVSHEWLRGQLQALWKERLEDAKALQELLQSDASFEETGYPRLASNSCQRAYIRSTACCASSRPRHASANAICPSGAARSTSD
jgi:hypothetical protein